MLLTISVKAASDWVTMSFFESCRFSTAVRFSTNADSTRAPFINRRRRICTNLQKGRGSHGKRLAEVQTLGFATMQSALCVNTSFAARGHYELEPKQPPLRHALVSFSNTNGSGMR